MGRRRFVLLKVDRKNKLLYNHPSIQWIMYKYKSYLNLKTEFVSTNQVPKYINDIDCKKSTSGDIPVKLIKIAKDKVIGPITNRVNKCIL